MHSWIFRNRQRLASLYGLAPRLEAPAPRLALPGPRESSPGGLRPCVERRQQGKVVVLNPHPRRVDLAG